MATSKIGKNAVANIAGVMIQMVIAFVMSPFLVHTLGDTRYGIWTIAAAFTGYMNLLDLGLSSAVNRYVAKYSSQNEQDSLNAIASTALTMFVVLGGVIVLISPLMADLVVGLVNLDNGLTEVVHLLIIVMSFDVGIFIIAGVFHGIFGGLQRYAIINYVQVGAALYKAVLFYLFLTNDYGLVAMGGISITANILAATAFYVMLRRLVPGMSFSLGGIRRVSASKLLNYSKYTFIAMLANQLIYYSDAFVIGFFLTAASVTHYAIPWTLAEYTKKILISISKTFSPAVSEVQAVGETSEIQRLLLSGTRYMIIVSNLLSVGVIVLGGAFIAIWMGPEYRELGELVLVILFVNQFVMGPQLVSYAVLKGLAKQRGYSYTSILVSVVNLLLSITLVQHYGIVGVAVGAAVPQVLFHGIYVPIVTLKAIGLSRWQYIKATYLPSIIPTAALFVVLFSFRNAHYPTGYLALLSMASLAAVVYLGLSLIFMITADERRYLAARLGAALKSSDGVGEG